MDVQPQRCRVCGHLDVFPTSRCSSCSYLRSPLSLFGMIEADMPPGRREEKPTRSGRAPQKNAEGDEQASGKGADDKVLLDAAFKSVERLFERVRAEGEGFSDTERAELYESLLLSLLKVEREHLREALLKQEGERSRRLQMRQISLIWVSGWLLGILFYFALSVI